MTDRELTDIRERVSRVPPGAAWVAGLLDELASAQREHEATHERLAFTRREDQRPRPTEPEQTDVRSD